MSFDIYGQDLRRGHCEVHPDVHEEYPCFVCIRENKERLMRKEEGRKNSEAEQAYYDSECDKQRFHHEHGVPLV